MKLNNYKEFSSNTVIVIKTLFAISAFFVYIGGMWSSNFRNSLGNACYIAWFFILLFFIFISIKKDNKALYLFVGIWGLIILVYLTYQDMFSGNVPIVHILDFIGIVALIIIKLLYFSHASLSSKKKM